MIALVVAGVIAAQLEVPTSWTCEPVRFADGICDCGCNALDDDCSEDEACARDNCGVGFVVDDSGIVCVDVDGDDSNDDESGCASAVFNAGAGQAALLLLLLRRRRRGR